MISVSYEKSILPRKCNWCGKRIKPKTRFVEIYCFFKDLPELDMSYRFCDPHCAKCFHNHEMSKAKENKELRKIVLGENT